ncbi:MAG: hypothetical protein CMN60_04600 [Sphingobium sp.]|nr:hypothetical protein [Sphingobium sp.]
MFYLRSWQGSRVEDRWAKGQMRGRLRNRWRTLAVAVLEVQSVIGFVFCRIIKVDPAHVVDI